jgi:hypothetical protein
MTAEYSFEKRSVIILSLSIVTLLILVFFLGLLLGLGMEPTEPRAKAQLEANEPSKQQAEETASPAAGDVQAMKSDLSKETETKPVAPEFKEVSPQAEQPRISQPKKE